MSQKKLKTMLIQLFFVLFLFLSWGGGGGGREEAQTKCFLGDVKLGN